MARETSIAVIRRPRVAILAAALLTWPAAVATSQALPLDPAVMVDSLPNGLRYYIRVNKRPEQRAELRLVVRAGSVLERDDERGLAHFVEHMAFEGSTHFARNELVHYLESVGIRFGADLNAYTSFDETVYMLSLPTDTASIVDHAFTVLADWAGGVTFDSTAVERERGVIIEEWRLGQGAQQRVSNQQRPVMLHGSRYAARMPIGDTVVIRTASGATMRGFWKRWYRPDLMAVVAVGDFDPAAVAQLIRDHFGALERPSTPHGRPATTAVPPHAETLVTVAVDPELSGSSVSLLAKHVREPVATEAAWRRRMVDRFAGQLLNERLDEVRQRPNAPFVYAYGGTTGLVKSTDAFQLVAVVKDGGIADGLAAVVREAARAGRFGFRATELERAQRDLLRQFESANEERDKTPSASHAADYVSHFVDGAPAMGIAREYALAQQYIPGITLGEVNAVAAAWLRAGSRVLAASLPRKDDVPVRRRPPRRRRPGVGGAAHRVGRLGEHRAARAIATTPGPRRCDRDHPIHRRDRVDARQRRARGGQADLIPGRRDPSRRIPRRRNQRGERQRLALGAVGRHADRRERARRAERGVVAEAIGWCRRVSRCGTRHAL